MGRGEIRWWISLDARWFFRDQVRIYELSPLGDSTYIMESLILAQNERWRRVLSMQVERQW